jgi:ABC-2 type transport system permease protein
MGPILTIARRDLFAYYHSLRGGIVFWFFLLFIGMFFNSFIQAFFEMQQRAMSFGGDAPRLGQLMTAVFQNLHFVLLLIVPAITMASFAEENRTQVFRLLQTAPISVFQIVMGKFLAGLGLLTLVLLASTLYPLYLVIYGNPDVGPILSSYLGMLLLMASHLALGIWISSMVNNQFIAFVVTMFGLFLLLILNWIAPNVTSTGWAEQVLKYFASTTHLDNFFKGLLTVQDIVYFIAFVSLFLFLTHVSIDSKRWR